MTIRITLDGFHKDAISMRETRSSASPLQLYAAFRRHHPTIVMPVDYVTECGFRLGLWQDRQRVARMLGTLPPQRIAQLDAIGFVWSDDDLPLAPCHRPTASGDGC
jgi:hypothetical protein